MESIDSRFMEALEQASRSFCRKEPVLLINGTYTSDKEFCANINVFGDVDMLLVSLASSLNSLIDSCPEESQMQIYMLFAQQLDDGLQAHIDKRDSDPDTQNGEG